MRGIVEASIYNIVIRSSAKYSVCIYMISVAVIIYSGKVIGSSQILLSAPSTKASEGVLTDLARELRLWASLRGMKSSVSSLE